MPSFRISMRQQWFAHARLLVAYLPQSRRDFSATLTTPALNRRRLRWFGLSACTASPEGPPPSLAQHASCCRSSTSPSLRFQDTHPQAAVPPPSTPNAAIIRVTRAILRLWATFPFDPEPKDGSRAALGHLVLAARQKRHQTELHRWHSRPGPAGAMEAAQSGPWPAPKGERVR